jgi:two-component SAPR family response regulator
MKDVMIFSDDASISRLLSYTPSEKKVTMMPLSESFALSIIASYQVSTIVIDIRHEFVRLKEVLDFIYIHERRVRVILITNGSGEFSDATLNSPLLIFHDGNMTAGGLERAIDSTDSVKEGLSLGDITKALLVDHFSNSHNKGHQRHQQEAEQHG